MSFATVSIGSPQLKWRIDMQTPAKINAGSVETVRFGVYADSAGAPVNVIAEGYNAQVAFTSEPTEAPATWADATWDVTIIGQYTAGVLVGTAPLTLAAGTWYAWVKLSVPGGETIVRQVGRLIVE